MVGGGLAGLAAWYVSDAWLWAVGAVVLLANWPFTLWVIFPTNKALMATPPEQAGPESRALLLTWGRLHNIRSGFGLGATLLFGAAASGF